MIYTPKCLIFLLGKYVTSLYVMNKILNDDSDHTKQTCVSVFVRYCFSRSRFEQFISTIKLELSQIINQLIKVCPFPQKKKITLHTSFYLFLLSSSILVVIIDLCRQLGNCYMSGTIHYYRHQKQNSEPNNLGPCRAYMLEQREGNK